MIRIPLTQGQVALVDDDCASLADLRWYAEKRERTFYATRNRPKVGGKNVGIVRMHHFVLPFLFGMEVDHINGNGLDNRRCNLRLAHHRNNQRNRRPNRGRSLKGAYLDKRSGRWASHLCSNGHLKHLGTFATAEEAARAYDAAASKEYGEFARLNFPTTTSRPRRTRRP